MIPGGACVGLVALSIGARGFDEGRCHPQREDGCFLPKTPCHRIPKYRHLFLLCSDRQRRGGSAVPGDVVFNARRAWSCTNAGVNDACGGKRARWMHAPFAVEALAIVGSAARDPFVGLGSVRLDRDRSRTAFAYSVRPQTSPKDRLDDCFARFCCNFRLRGSGGRP